MDYLIQVGIGAFILTMFFIFDRKTIRIEWDAISRFLAFMTLATCIRIAMYDLVMRINPGAIPQMHQQLLEMPKILFAMVWWEDAFFVLPIFLAWKYCSKYIFFLVALGMSMWFGFGHAYQGLYGIMITSIYPVFISLRYGRKYGFGTVMIGHILYDYITYFTIIIAPLLV